MEPYPIATTRNVYKEASIVTRGSWRSRPRGARTLAVEHRPVERWHDGSIVPLGLPGGVSTDGPKADLLPPRFAPPGQRLT